MRFSYWIPNTLTWAETLESGRSAEALGYDGLWYPDHFMPNAPGPADGFTPEAMAVLAGLAATVPRVRLGALVAGNTYRHPAVLANAMATIDEMSGGRVVIGLGAGWQENEHRAYGIEFSTFPWRFDRLEEACQVLKALFNEPRASYSGRHYQLDDAPLDPKGVNGMPPLLIGGGGERRTLRIVARYADEWNVWGMPELLAQKGEVLARHCEAVGRDPATILHSAQALLFLSDDQATLDRVRARRIERPTIIGTPAEVQDVVGRYRDAGVDELIVPGFTFRSGAERDDTLARFLDEVAKPFRA
jgi:F420-dependent oxidoreductase-like protein